jgi:hypothetical protein
MRNSNTTYQDRVNAIVERDEITSTNLRALWSNRTQPGTVTENVHQWLIKAALRRHRKEVAAATGPLNNTLAALTIGRIKARRFNGSKG